MPKISVIIPVYNVEKYLVECLDSVINQTFKDIEIICINDGSTDNSSTILETYASKDKRIKIFNQENKGLSITRNVGIKISQGSYIFFLDSDDYLNKDILERLYKTAITSKSDVVCSSTRVFTKNTENKKILNITNNLTKYFNTFNNLIEYKVDELNLINSIDKFPVVAWGKLYLRKFLSKYKITFPNNNFVHEDDAFWLKILSCNPTISKINNIGVNYRIRENSIITSQKKQINNSHLRNNLKEVFCFIKKTHPKHSKLLIKQIKLSNKYCTCFEINIKETFLYRWGKNNKKIKLLGLTLYKQQLKNDFILTKILGINIKRRK